MSPSICIISFSYVNRDARVLRQIEYLVPHYDLTVIGYGEAPARLAGETRAQWAPVATHSTFATRFSGAALLVLGRLWHHLYQVWYWQKPHHQMALELALQSHAAAFLANDWNALPVAAEAAQRTGARLVFDSHEYAPLEFENRRYWMVFYSPMVKYLLKKYAVNIGASMTVSPLIAERYRREFNFSPVTVLNAPKLVPIHPGVVDANNIRLVHHGGAMPDRRTELMIEALAQADSRFSLHFFLVGAEDAQDYIRRLKDLAARLAPDRITFHEPVPPTELVERISEYEMGIFILEPNSYNYLVTLPNKLFDFLAAGLAICVGPSPAMSELVRKYGVGCVTPTFDPAVVARTLNGLTADEISTMRAAARKAALQFNADTEMSKVLDIFRTT